MILNVVFFWEQLTGEDAHWAGSFNWATVFQPGDGRERNARGLAAQSDGVLHDHTHIFWNIHLADYTGWDWREREDAMGQKDG